MWLSMRIVVSTACIILVVLCAPAAVSRASSWPMHQCDAARTGVSDERVELPLRYGWIKTPEASYSERRTRPVIADGKVYVGKQWLMYDIYGKRHHYGQLQAISLSTGAPLWSVGQRFVSATPALANGHVYFGTEDGMVYALDARTGIELWSYNAGGVPTSPAVVGHKLYITTLTGRVIMLNGESGTEQWAIERQVTSSAPSVSDDTLYVGGTELTAIDRATGAVRWSFRDPSGAHSMPVVRGDSVFFSCSYALYCLRASDGAVRWMRFTGDRYGSLKVPSVSQDTLYWGAVTAIDPGTGKVKWTFDSGNDVHNASVAIADGHVFVGASHDYGTAFDHSDGRLYVLRASSGEVVWKYEAGVRSNDWYLIDPSPAVAEGAVVLNLSTVQLRCFRLPEQIELPLELSASKVGINPYDAQDGSVDIRFTLPAAALVVAEVIDYQGRAVKRLVKSPLLEAGEHTVTWHGLVDFPEMADPALAGEFGDRCVRVAPDGDYTIRVSAHPIAHEGQYVGTVPVTVKASI